MNLSNFKSINKKFALASVTLLTLSSLGSAGLALADTWTGSSAGGSIIINAEQAAPTTDTDTTAGVDANGTSGNDNVGMNNQTNAAGTTNDGTAQNGSQTTPSTGQSNIGTSNTTGATGAAVTSHVGGNYGMSNVTFSVTSITPAKTTTIVSPNKETVNANGVAGGMKEPTTNVVASGDPSTVENYGFTLGATQNVTTGTNGVATMSNLPDGYYLVQQETLVGGVTEITPFIVQVSNGSSTNVYPKENLNTSNATYNTAVTDAKNAVTGVNETGVTLNAPKAVDTVTDTATADTGNIITVAAGNKVTFNLNTTFDTSQVSGGSTATSSNSTSTTTGSYSLSDTLPVSTALAKGTTSGALDPSEVSVLVPVNTTSAIPLPNGGSVTPDTNGNLTLPASDYSASIASGVVTVTLNAQGQQDVNYLLQNDAAANAVANSSTSNQSETIDVQLNTVATNTIASTVASDDTNSYSTTVTNAYGVTLSAATSTAATSTVIVGGTQLTKVDSNKNNLAGAQFVLVEAANIDDAKALVEANSNLFKSSPSDPDGSSTNTLAAVSDLTKSSLANGSNTASFVTGDAGLTTAPANVTSTNLVKGTSDTNGIIEFTGLNLNDDLTDLTASPTKTNQNYYAVELVAPSGYQLPNAATGQNVFQLTAADTTQTVNDTNTFVYNAKPFNLPFTGGEGIAAVLVMAGVAAGGAIIVRKRRNNEEEKA